MALGKTPERTAEEEPDGVTPGNDLVAESLAEIKRCDRDSCEVCDSLHRYVKMAYLPEEKWFDVFEEVFPMEDE